MLTHEFNDMLTLVLEKISLEKKIYICNGELQCQPYEL